MRTVGGSVKALALLVALCLAAVPAMADTIEEGRHPNSRLRGLWGGVVQGVVEAGTPNGPLDFAALLVLTFDGDGGFTGTVNSSFNGTITGTTPLTGSYQVNADGTGSLVAHFPGGLPDAHVDFILVDHGKEMLSFQTDAAHVNVGVLKRR